MTPLMSLLSEVRRFLGRCRLAFAVLPVQLLPFVTRPSQDVSLQLSFQLFMFFLRMRGI